MEIIKKKLAAFHKKTITLTELEQLFVDITPTYEEFSHIILSVENEGILTMIKSKGRTGRNPSLAFSYRIEKSFLVDAFHKELQRYRNHLHPFISIDDYYRKEPEIWKLDFPFIEKIDAYLKHRSLPTEPVPAPERSYELTGDEKWITDKGGKDLLERLRVFDKLAIIPVSEPLMFAIHPARIHARMQHHLIVENKTTYQGLLPALKETSFSTLIYGAGKAIIKSIEQFPAQFPVEGEHRFFYFGDIDREGISIWYSLNQRKTVQLAIPFYLACLKREAVPGKAYQLERKEAMTAFLGAFENEEQYLINSLLSEGNYLPQETLKTGDLQQIWRESNWKG